MGFRGDLAQQVAQLIVSDGTSGRAKQAAPSSTSRPPMPSDQFRSVAIGLG